VILVLDIGNTETTIGLFDAGQLLRAFRVGTAPGRTADELALLLAQAFPEIRRGAEVAIASVEPASTPAFAEAARRTTGGEPLLVSAAMETGLEIEYRDPLTLGADRLANAVAAFRLYGAPVIVVDLGTATKFEVVVKDRRYRGGAIAPGVRTAAEALVRRGARLGAFEWHAPEHAAGRSTEECLQSGVLYGAVGMIDGMVRRLAAEERIRPMVIATGGLAGLLAPHSETIERVDPDLTLHGLRILHELNAPGSAEPGPDGERADTPTPKARAKPKSKSKTK
jgi:type III pantothenate kinase